MMWPDLVLLSGGKCKNFTCDFSASVGKALGIDIPPTLLVRADEVIE
jgi:hypothetical protein